MYRDIMVDLETLDNKPTSAIVTIGACAFNFDTGEIGPTFYKNIHPESAQQCGGSLSASTVLWWLNQSPEAQKALTSPGALLQPDVLQQFTEYCIEIRKTNPKGNLGVWANAPSFDCTILEGAYDCCNMPVPYAFWETRCVRTMVALGKDKGFDPKSDMPRDGAAHDALSDAIHQARYTIAIKHVLDGGNASRQ